MRIYGHLRLGLHVRIYMCRRGACAWGIRVRRDAHVVWRCDCIGMRALGVVRDGGYGEYVIVDHPKFLVDVDGLDPDTVTPYACSGVTVYNALKKAGMTLDRIDLFEFNEAFAAQAIAVMRHLGMDPSKVNVNGGAIALGHPLGATGSKLSVQLIHELRRRGGGIGMVTMCVGGGMGAAGIFEVYGQ